MAKKLWGGRFKKETDKDFFEFQKSIHYDYRLAEEDIYHSLIHVLVLEKSAIISKTEKKKLFGALYQIREDVKKGTFNFDPGSEDIHTDIQNKIEAKVGKLAAKLHSLRSRNDQIVFDEKFFCAESSFEVWELMQNLLGNILFLMERFSCQLFIGYTHTRRAQVILFRHYLGAFFHMFDRDLERVRGFYNRLFICIGSGALAGSYLKREHYEQAIKDLKDQDSNFKKIMPPINALDNVSDRDFVIDFLSILAILQMHMSRLAEDLILYSTKEFNFIDLPEEFCTGSSLMPHKKNPDLLELIRGYTGRVYGNLLAVLTTMKGLPLTYNRDMQLDKEPLFSSLDIVKAELKMISEMIKKINLNETEIERALEDRSLYATELSEFLVFQHKVPFQDAHEVVGALIRYSEDKGMDIDSLSDKEIAGFHPALNKETVEKIMNARYAVNSKKSISKKKPRIKKNSLA